MHKYSLQSHFLEEIVDALLREKKSFHGGEEGSCLHEKEKRK